MSDLGELFDTAVAEVADGGGDSGESVVADGADNPDVGSAVEDEQTGADAGSTESGESQVEAWDWSEFSDREVSITVNGQEERVPLSELRDGYMRQADYTQKTQEVSDVRKAADWARDVQAALDADPEATLRVIAQAWGVESVSNGNDSQQAPSLDDLDEDVRPWAEQAQQANAELAQVRQQLASIEQDRIVASVRSEIDGLRAEHGDSFNPEESLRLAAAKNISLEDAHWMLQGQRQRQVSAATAGVVDEVEAGRRQAKAAASSKSRSFKASEVPTDNFDSIGDLMEIIMANSDDDLS